VTAFLNPKTGATIGYQETKGTTAEPFNVPMAWQASSLSYVSLSVDANGNLNVNGSGGGTGSVTVKGLSLTPASPTSATVGATSGQVLAANANRTGLVLVNTSANYISFGINNAAVLYSGITLTPNGVWEMDSFTFSTAAINAIASVASSNLAIQEFS